MSKNIKLIATFFLIFTMLSSSFFGTLSACADDVAKEPVRYDDINADNVFLKQETPITCTLASAVMMMRRTAIIAGYEKWEEISEINLRDTAWRDGIGLLWDYTFYNMTVGHGYYPQEIDKKQFMLDLLERYPQGVVVYNIGAGGQNHAVFLCDYNSDEDMFYVADPATNAPSGRIPLTESTIYGETQDEQIQNLSAYWFVSTPQITLENGVYTSSGTVSNPYDPALDIESFDASKVSVNNYFVVTNDSQKGAAVRYYPSGSSSVSEYVTKGDILYVTYSGENNFGAEWYKLNSEHYIFNTNLMPFSEYSGEVVKFNNTKKETPGTYKVDNNKEKIPLRLEPAEGNNVVGYLEDSQLVYVTHSGVNSVGASWLKTEDGYYLKTSQVKLVSAEKLPESAFNGDLILLIGKYSSEPVEDAGQQTPPNEEPKNYKITATALNLRKTPVDGEVLTTIPENAVVEVVSVVDGWGKTTYNGYVGWISLEYAEIVTDVPVFKLESIILSSAESIVGEKVTCTVNVQATVSRVYKFAVFNNSGEMVYSAPSYVARSSFDYYPEVSGVYYFSIEVLCNDGRVLSAYSGNFSVYDKLQIESVGNNIDEYAYVSDEIVWYVNTVSVSESMVYSYKLYCDEDLIAEIDSEVNEYPFVPEKAGNYVMEVYLSDKYTSSETVVCEPVTVYDNLKIEAIVITSDLILKGQEATYSVITSGGTGEYQYCFTVFKEGTIIENGIFTSSNSATTVFNNEGIYRVFCAVKDSGNLIVSAFSSDIKVVVSIPGDVDNDGFVTAKDARLTLRHSAGLEKIDDRFLISADVNNDSKVNAADARLILRCAAKLEEF